MAYTFLSYRHIYFTLSISCWEVIVGDKNGKKPNNKPDKPGTTQNQDDGKRPVPGQGRVETEGYEGPTKHKKEEKGER